MFADDTNVTAINQTTENIAYDLREISNWLNANKLTVNISKTFKMSIGSSASSSLQHPYSFSNSIISATTYCEYQGKTIDSKLSFLSHIDSVVERLGKQSGIVCMLRHYVKRKHLIDYTKSNITPNIQYDVVVYDCGSRIKLNPIFTLQKKISKMIFYRTKRDHCEDLFFVFNEISTVFELHVYELLKFVLRSLTKGMKKLFYMKFFMKLQIDPPVDLLKIYIKFPYRNPKKIKQSIR